MAYYDIFLAPIANEKRADYDAFVEATQKMMLDLGATQVVDLWGDDVPDGKLTSLPLAVKLEEGESVAAGWVIWPSKEIRDTAWGKMMEADDMGEMPFDGKRMMFGGFSEILSSTA
ncbi:DUF1428 domain-containing protein [Thalassococcus sp. BH17M4-6]|uniref:DUF1428 domain-containing protein n=1 Tax=Thalassococcus sp. BH17M4-6 TaxID=3413148 RepID=UPI003BD8F544